MSIWRPRLRAIFIDFGSFPGHTVVNRCLNVPMIFRPGPPSKGEKGCNVNGFGRDFYFCRFVYRFGVKNSQTSMVLEKMGIKSLYLERVNGLIKTDILTSKVLSEGLKKIVKLEGVDEKKEPFEKTKKITKGVTVALSSEAKQKIIKSL